MMVMVRLMRAAQFKEFFFAYFFICYGKVLLQVSEYLAKQQAAISFVYHLLVLGYLLHIAFHPWRLDFIIRAQAKVSQHLCFDVRVHLFYRHIDVVLSDQLVRDQPNHLRRQLA